MIKFFFIILIIFSGCSLEKKTFFKDKITSENKEIDLKKKDNKEIIQEDINKNIKINLSKIIKNNKFKELTLVPLEKELIEKKILNKNEVNWINSYHNKVKKNLLKFMNFNEKAELVKACSPI